MKRSTILDGQKSRAVSIIRRLKKTHPDARVALQYSNPLELLVATILSAQCTDARVNMVAPMLFKKYRTAHDYASANRKELEREIRSTGFYRAKAKNIIGCCKALVEKFDRRVPKTMEELVTLPGVGRKTANVVLGNVFGIADGIVVDTHVARLSQRLGFSRNTNPEKIEQDLMSIIPKKDWIAIGDLLIWHGRRVCQARKPKCPECTISDLCPSFEIYMKQT
jgi:endonuclease-3